MFRIGGIYSYKEIDKENLSRYTIGKLWFRDSSKKSRWIDNDEIIFILEKEDSSKDTCVYKVLIGVDIGWIYTEEKYWNEIS